MRIRRLVTYSIFSLLQLMDYGHPGLLGPRAVRTASTTDEGHVTTLRQPTVADTVVEMISIRQTAQPECVEVSKTY